MREVGGARFEWGYTEHLLAAVVDLLAQSNYLFVSAHSKTKPPVPKPLERPGQGETRKKRKRTTAEIDAILAKAREVASGIG